MPRRGDRDHDDLAVVYADIGDIAARPARVPLRRRPRVLAGRLLALVVLVAVGAWWLHRVDPDTPHSNPDPGGRRLAFLRATAEGAVPEGATGARTTVARYRWDHGGCDGGAAGWTRAEVDVTFSGGTLQQIDEAMTSQGWRRFSDTQRGDAAREYIPVGATDDGFAWLFRTGRGWEVDVSTAPAEVPTHAC